MCSKWGIVFICICCSGYVTAAKVHCQVFNYKNRGFSQPEKGSLPPGNVTWLPDLLISAYKSNQLDLILEVKGIREDFNLTTFAIPFIENESECPRSLTENSNLRQYHRTCSMMASANKSVMQTSEIYIEKIFTGCYYFMTTNGTGKNWVLGPAFYNTSYPYYDTKLRLVENITVTNEDQKSTQKMSAKLRVPLACIKVSAEMFEYNAEIDNATYDIESGKIPPSQDCWFSKGDQRKANSCKGSHLVTKLELEVHTVDHESTGNEWTVLFEWNGLKSGGGKYYLRFEPHTLYCNNEFYTDFNTWTPLDKDIRIDLGHKNGTNVLPTIKQNGDNPNLFLILYFLLALIVIAILGYWIWKYSSVWKRKSLWPTTEPPEEKLDDEHAGRKSDAILLLYVPGSPEFMSIIETLRNSLKKVYDAYGVKEWCKIAELGANRWTEQLLQDDCRVVWVDTPEFRSRVNDKYYIAQDSREEVIIFAVHWEKFARDSTTQYLRHFVLQVEGFEIEDGSVDPLLWVSSLCRYRFPDHLSLLCNQLRQPEEQNETNV